MLTLEGYKALNIKKGTIHSIHYKRVVSQVRKAFKGRVEKETIGNFRIGCSYENLAVNKEKITGPLPYGYFEYSNEIIYSPTTDTYQLRLTITNNKNVKPMVKWYLDGVETTKEHLIEIGAMADSKSKTDLLVFNVKLNDIIEIK